MTMKTFRLKALRTNPFVCHASNKRARKYKDRVALAINATWSIKELPDDVRELVIERACLRVEITTIKIKEQGDSKPSTTVLISSKLKRIDEITTLLKNRKFYA